MHNNAWRYNTTMSTLKQLQSGQLLGAKELKLCEGLITFPKEIYTLADTLERLDMTDNKLSTLPDDFHCLKNLKILFLSNNNFRELPSILAKCPKLSMIGFRNNQIDTVKENTLPLSTRWLILTDNALTSLPSSMGDLTLLQKCMLSGNKLTSLPTSMRKCHNLELLRLSANLFDVIPKWLFDLPKLSWLAYGGNPLCTKHEHKDVPLEAILWEDLEVQEVLGEGASGQISKALWTQGNSTSEVAIKVFKGEITSDGLPQEEMDINIAMGQHDNLVDVLARVSNHPEGKDVLVLELIPTHYTNLGLPPSLVTCTRDTYPEGFTLSLVMIINLLRGIVSAAVHMHERNIMHGDFYAHNIMIDTEGNSILGDFGGASYYDNHVEDAMLLAHERLEVRAFGCLVEEMLVLSHGDSSDLERRKKLVDLKVVCLDRVNTKRPVFVDIQKELENL